MYRGPEIFLNVLKVQLHSLGLVLLAQGQQKVMSQV